MELFGLQPPAQRLGLAPPPLCEARPGLQLALCRRRAWAGKGGHGCEHSARDPCASAGWRPNPQRRAQSQEGLVRLPQLLPLPMQAPTCRRSSAFHAVSPCRTSTISQARAVICASALAARC